MWKDIVFKRFIQRFKNEYLLAVLEKHSSVKRNIKQPSKLSVGEVVIIKDGNVNRLSWRKGRITKLIESRDNNVRTVELKRSVMYDSTSHSTFGPIRNIERNSRNRATR